MKRLLILGSTGSIGVNTLNVVRNFPSEFKVEALTVNTNISLLYDQILEFKPSYVVVSDEISAGKLRQRIGDICKVYSGCNELVEAAKRDTYDILVNALVGFAGLAPTVEGIKLGKRIALANKETLVAGGEIVTSLCVKHKSEIIPIDSEHSAVFQCLKGENKSEIERIILTASGGPFLCREKETFTDITVAEALKHPNWSMGNKITIDSATMMNKGLEVIEARWLFGIQVENIDVLIHPQSIIHSMVEFVDGSVKAQLGLPDMKLPIQYALTYPDRFSNKNERANFPKISNLTFFEPDFEKFECLKLAYDVIEEGGTAPCILNAANEVAVSKFLEGKIRFLQIPDLIKVSLDKIENHKPADIESVYESDRQTREFAANLYQ